MFFVNAQQFLQAKYSRNFPIFHVICYIKYISHLFYTHELQLTLNLMSKFFN